LEYDKLLSLSVPYHPETVLKDANVGTGTFDRAVIETRDRTYVFRTTKEVKRIEFTPPEAISPTLGYIERITSEMWVEDNSI